MDPEIQKELLKQTVEPRQALELAINMELGMRNQHQIQQHNKIDVPANVNAVQFNNNPRKPYWQNTNNVPKQNNCSKLYCSKCGGTWFPNHREKCIVKGKTCNNCGLLNHFAKVCRKKNTNKKPQDPKKKTVRVVEEEPHPEDSVYFLQPAKLYESDYNSGDEDNTVAMIETAVEKVEPLNMPSRLVISIPHYLWTPGAHAVYSIVHSRRRWYRAALVHSGSRNQHLHNYGPFLMNRYNLRERSKSQ